MTQIRSGTHPHLLAKLPLKVATKADLLSSNLMGFFVRMLFLFKLLKLLTIEKPILINYKLQTNKKENKSSTHFTHPSG